MTASRFLKRNRESEPKPTTFSSNLSSSNPPLPVGVSEYAHCMIYAGRKRRPSNVGSWVEGPLPVSLFCSSSYFLFFISSPIQASVACVAVDGFAFYLEPFFLRSFLVIFLGIVACRHAVAGKLSL